MYDGHLKAHDDVKHHKMNDIYKSSGDDILSGPLLVIDTAGALMYE
jgi:hypothetical protein